ncbi:MAG: 50S ribosomal protein L24 [Archaeoglobaceae archaeon]|nr:50S ribosomal protein L24 [Archaeoglobaceae archaeon]
MLEVDMKKCRIKIEGVTTTKVRGVEVSVPVHPSNVMILSFGKVDDVRRKALER